MISEVILSITLKFGYFFNLNFFLNWLSDLNEKMNDTLKRPKDKLKFNFQKIEYV
jgi:hypothetical protein